jgi:hypothetical protein
VKVVAESTKAGRLPEPPSALAAHGSSTETDLGLFNGQDRRPIAVVVTSDGRRTELPLNDAGSVEVSALALLRSLLIGLDGLIGRISRRENGGSRR